MAVGASPGKEGRGVVVGQISDECQGEAMLMDGWQEGSWHLLWSLDGGLPFFFSFFAFFFLSFFGIWCECLGVLIGMIS